MRLSATQIITSALVSKITRSWFTKAFPKKHSWRCRLRMRPRKADWYFMTGLKPNTDRLYRNHTLFLFFQHVFKKNQRITHGIISEMYVRVQTPNGKGYHSKSLPGINGLYHGPENPFHENLPRLYRLGKSLSRLYGYDLLFGDFSTH